MRASASRDEPQSAATVRPDGFGPRLRYALLALFGLGVCGLAGCGPGLEPPFGEEPGAGATPPTPDDGTAGTAGDGDSFGGDGDSAGDGDLEPQPPTGIPGADGDGDSPDAGVPDGGLPDGGLPDGGLPGDGSMPDAGFDADAGVDAGTTGR